MFKRVMMIGILGASLLTTFGSKAEAHLEGYQVINGYVRHVASFDCGITIKKVSNLTQHPAVFECAATITEVETLCRNPATQDVAPGKAATQVTIIAQNDLQEGDITDKKRGRAEKAVTIDEDPVFGVGQRGSEFCVNPNWFLHDVLVTAVKVVLTTYECTGPDDDPCSQKIPAYVEELACTLPSEFNITNPPPPNTDYDCDLISKEHVD